jgi:hypothetical protein
MGSLASPSPCFDTRTLSVDDADFCIHGPLGASRRFWFATGAEVRCSWATLVREQAMTGVARQGREESAWSGMPVLTVALTLAGDTCDGRSKHSISTSADLRLW